jgi:two-component system, chemotaxis family, chemotaxis protein CheY
MSNARRLNSAAGVPLQEPIAVLRATCPVVPGRSHSLKRSEQMSGASQSSRVILAVDDSASMRQMVRFTLESAGYRVVQAVDGIEALDFAKTSAVDLVLTDVNMPRMDGITLVRELRGLSTYKFTPVLVLTTESGQDTKQRGKQAGATGWIVKPFSPEQLLSTIARVL